MRSLILASLAIGLAACGGAGTSGPPPDPAIAASGTYQLQTFNGSALPYTVIDTFDGTYGNREEVVGGAEVLGVDHTYTETWQNRWTDASGASLYPSAVTGNFDLVGTSITFHVLSGNSRHSYVGAVSGGALTYTDGSYSLKYQR